MAIVKSALIQAALNADTADSCEAIRDKMLAKHLDLLEQAGRRGAQIVCLQEVFNAPYFCPSQDDKWFASAEAVPDGPTIQALTTVAREHAMVIVAPVFERDPSGAYFNTAAVIDADGSYLGKYRKVHIPDNEQYHFAPSELGYPVFETRYATIGVYICYDRHYPEGARILGLNGAQIVYNPSATWIAKSQHLWFIEQRALAANNRYFVGTINRVGEEAPWNLGRFYGSSYFCDPHGRIVAQAGEDGDEVLLADLDLDLIAEARAHWGFEAVRRPETYGALTAR